jgi:hypothetical protein
VLAWYLAKNLKKEGKRVGLGGFASRRTPDPDKFSDPLSQIFFIAMKVPVAVPGDRVSVSTKYRFIEYQQIGAN